MMITLFSSIAFATDVTTDYSGSGELIIQTNIQSEFSPTITDYAHINTGCVTCCCLGLDCCSTAGRDYSGQDIVTNEPFSASVHTVNVTNGCVVINQSYNDDIDNHQIQTNYYTYFNGTGSAESYIYAFLGNGTSYQFANGIGSAFVGFTQNIFSVDAFDYGTNYGGGVTICSPGYAGLMNKYQYSGGEIYYNAQLGMYCEPVSSESSLYAFLFSNSANNFNLESGTLINNIKQKQSIEANGVSDYGTLVSSKSGNISFNFDMILG